MGIRFGSGLKPVHSPYVAGLLTLGLDMKRKRRDFYVREIKSSELSVRLEGTKKLARLLEADPRIGDLMPEDIRVLIEFLKHRENPELQFYALYALTNVDANGGELIKTEALPFLVQLMKSKHRHTKMQVLITLGQIAYDSPELAGYLCEIGSKVLQNIVVEYKYDDVMLLNCSNFLAIVFHSLLKYSYASSPKPPLPLLREWEMKRLYHILNLLLQRGRWYKILLSDVLVAITYFSQCSPWTSGRKACTVYLDLISDADPLIVVSALKAIGNIVSSRIEWMMEGGLMQCLYSLSKYSRYKLVRFQVCYILTEIARITHKRNKSIDFGAFRIVKNANGLMFNGIKDLVTGQQIDFAEPEDDFIRDYFKFWDSIGPFSFNIRSGVSWYSKLRWVAEAYTEKEFY